MIVITKTICSSRLWVTEMGAGAGAEAEICYFAGWRDWSCSVSNWHIWWSALYFASSNLKCLKCCWTRYWYNISSIMFRICSKLKGPCHHQALFQSGMQPTALAAKRYQTTAKHWLLQGWPIHWESALRVLWNTRDRTPAASAKSDASGRQNFDWQGDMSLSSCTLAKIASRLL